MQNSQHITYFGGSAYDRLKTGSPLYAYVLHTHDLHLRYTDIVYLVPVSNTTQVYGHHLLPVVTNFTTGTNNTSSGALPPLYNDLSAATRKQKVCPPFFTS